MAIDFPSYSDEVNRIRADVAANLPSVDPTIYGSIIRAITDSLAGRCYDIILLQKQLLKQMFPQTASGEFLDLWAQYENITRLISTASSGYVTFSGNALGTIPIDTVIKSSAGLLYKAQSQGILSSTNISVSSITRVGFTAYVTTDSAHHLSTGISVAMSGAVQSAYNGTFSIIVTGIDSFTYSLSTTPSSPASGTITATATIASVLVQCEATGISTNIDSGAQLSLVTPIPEVNDIAYVQFTGITGGGDDETDSELLIRVLQSRSEPVSNFNIGAIKKAALSITGVTRVWVQRCTPSVGQVTIYFMRDNDSDTIPSEAEIAEVADVILELLPGNSSEDDVFIYAPTPVSVDFTFTDIVPNTGTMKAAVSANIQAFFSDVVDFETDILEDKYRAAIINTIDPDTGDTLESFTLSEPSGDIDVGYGEIAVMGTITFNIGG